MLIFYFLLKCTNLPSKRASDDRLAVNLPLFWDEEYIFLRIQLDYVQ